MILEHCADSSRRHVLLTSNVVSYKRTIGDLYLSRCGLELLIFSDLKYSPSWFKALISVHPFRANGQTLMWKSANGNNPLLFPSELIRLGHWGLYQHLILRFMKDESLSVQAWVYSVFLNMLLPFLGFTCWFPYILNMTQVWNTATTPWSKVFIWWTHKFPLHMSQAFMHKQFQINENQVSFWAISYRKIMQ